MPKTTNGNDPAPTPEQQADYALGIKMLNEIREFWMGQQAADPTLDQVKLYRIGVVAFSQWASILGVDVGMTVEQFTNVCRANFETAYDRAPKFGE
jgi:hypothetical protein